MNRNTLATVSPLLVQPRVSRDTKSRQMAELSLGVVEALRGASITWEQARHDLFNLDNYLQAKKLRLHPKLIEAFEWAMEMEDVAALAPASLGQSFDRVVALLRQVMREAGPRDHPKGQPGHWVEEVEVPNTGHPYFK